MKLDERKTLTALRLSFFFLTACYLTWVPRIPEIKDALNISVETLGLLFMMVGVVGALTMRYIAIIINRITARRSMVVAVIVSTLGNAVIAYASSLWMLAAGLIVASMSAFLLNTAVNTQANNLKVITGNNNLNNLSAIANIGSLLSMLLGAVLLIPLSAPQYIIGMQVIIAFATIWASRYMPTSDEGATAKGEVAEKMPWFGKNTGRFWLVIATIFATSVAEFSVTDWGSIISRDDFKIQAPFFLLPFVFFQAGIILSRFVADRLNARFGVARYVGTASWLAAVVWGISIQVATAINSSQPWLTFGLVAFGFFVAGWGIGPNWAALLTAVTNVKYPAPVVFARLFSIMSLVFVFGPGLVAGLAGQIGLPNAMMLPVLLLILVSTQAKRVLGESVNRP